VIALALTFTTACLAQSAKPSPPYPTHLPYAFSNFVWWTDADLRVQLKKRIPGLGDEIAPTQASESKVRDALKTLLRQKGIVADVMSEDPSPGSLTAEHMPEAPRPAIVFTILNPQILMDRPIVSGAPELLADTLSQSLQRQSGRDYSDRENWIIRTEVEEQLRQNGYFDSHVDIDHDAPRLDGDHYQVNLVVSATPGPQYHIGAITGDGGPLLQGRNLFSLFKVKPGDVAPLHPLGDFAGRLQVFYEHYGYADVVVEGPPILDREHALVSYHLSVTPGPLYHLRSITINHLEDAGQESKVRRLLGLVPGDPYDVLAINSLYSKLRVDSTLSGYDFTFSPAKDKSAGIVDLILDFSKKTDQPSVTTH
jgi:outer membrane protein insertion porin family